MWKLKEINIRNIVSINEASITFRQGVATLIFGKNEDNAAQPCNGSGKSSIIEAIAFALTGEQLRKVKSLDEIINDHEETASVGLVLDNDWDGTRFTIYRTISRSKAQAIECHKYNSDGMEIECDKTIQPTVADYNKFILSEIGLSKDDIYSNYILCDNKYESFFDSSDKEKKEIINRFSNGLLVDDSIVKLQADMEPLKCAINELNGKISNINGSISAIENELLHASEKTATAERDRQERIERADSQITEYREKMEAEWDKYEKSLERIEVLKSILTDIERMEESEDGLLESYRKIQQICKDNKLDEVTDFEALSQKYNQSIKEWKEKVLSIQYKQHDAEKTVEKISEEYKINLDAYNRHCETDSELAKSDKEMKEKINAELEKIDDELDKIEADIKKSKNHMSEIDVEISKVETLLNGAVTCPKCNHKFFVNADQTLDSAKKELEELRADSKETSEKIEQLNKQFDKIDASGAEKEGEIVNIDKAMRQRANRISEEYAFVKKLYSQLIDAKSSVSGYEGKLIEAKNEIDKLNGKIEVLRDRMFGEINGILEGRIMNGTNYCNQCHSSHEYMAGQLKSMQQYKKELMESVVTDFEASLKGSLNKYEDMLSEHQRSLSEVQSNYDMLKEQEVNFTQFKSYLANKKIDALSFIVNDFLEKIGSDIRLKLEGFTMTKTGKLRDKISVQVMRDGIDCGSFQKFSGGEKARLNLACILSLHALTNASCEDGKGLDFIIIDELLDKSDEVGMSTYCEALNKLKQTALLITQGAVSEGYPHKLLIVKRHGVSSIINQ